MKDNAGNVLHEFDVSKNVTLHSRKDVVALHLEQEDQSLADLMQQYGLATVELLNVPLPRKQVCDNECFRLTIILVFVLSFSSSPFILSASFLFFPFPSPFLPLFHFFHLFFSISFFFSLHLSILLFSVSFPLSKKVVMVGFDLVTTGENEETLVPNVVDGYVNTATDIGRQVFVATAEPLRWGMCGSTVLLEQQGDHPKCVGIVEGIYQGEELTNIKDNAAFISSAELVPFLQKVEARVRRNVHLNWSNDEDDD